jgi:hypothetical protein
VLCDACGAPVVGPRFDCAHCPGGFTACFDCEPALAEAHPARHVFLVRLDIDGTEAGRAEAGPVLRDEGMVVGGLL